jgi:NAD-dependent deacetylase
MAVSSNAFGAIEDMALVREALQRAAHVVALTGAGISAESGIPTFRGAGGLWRNFSPQQLATPEAFARDPCLVWEWYDWRRGLISKAQPNPGHLALAELERRGREAPSAERTFTLVTQNVDGLHDRAGSRNVVKLHGDIWLLRCTGCGAETRSEEVPLPKLPPRCGCGALLRPGVVWFGESLPENEWARALEASSRAQVFLAIGTSATVYPAADLANQARRAGAKVAVVNPEASDLDSMAAWVLRGRSGELLPRLL